MSSLRDDETGETSETAALFPSASYATTRTLWPGGRGEGRAYERIPVSRSIEEVICVESESTKNMTRVMEAVEKIPPRNRIRAPLLLF